ncbi:MAG: redoxin domain-containing protein [Elusimicrobia bacterium]|nr:redoxin domain-containing protein [Elusimicrobiota bacterium]
MKRTALIITGFILALSSSLPALEIGQDAPVFKIDQYPAGKVSLDDLKGSGNIVVLGFFDTNCEPCKKEIPYMNKLYERYLKDNSVKIRMISLDDNPAALKDFISGNSLKVPVLSDPSGWKAGTNYGVVRSGRAEIPQIFVIGKQGRIRKHLKGYTEHVDEVLADTIESLKKEEIAVKKSRTVTIVYTNSANGYLESCNCPENPFGGLVRRMTVLKDIRKKDPEALFIDCGDNFSVRQNDLQAEYVIRMMAMMDYNAIGIGDQEFIMGRKFLEKNISRLPYLCANISVCDDKTCWDLAKGYDIFEAGEARIAVLSVINPDIFVLFPKDRIEGVKFKSLMETIAGNVPHMRKNADIVVLLSHSGDEQDRKIASEVEGIDIIIGGHSQTLHKDPVKIGDTLIVQAGANGHRVGKITLKLDKNNSIKSYEHEQVLLIKDVPDDSEGRSIVDEYNNKLKEKAKSILIK